MLMRKPPPISTSVKTSALCRDALLPMGITSENVAKKFGISRQTQDELAVMSHARAVAAKQKFQAEIVPVKTILKDPKTNKKTDCDYLSRRWSSSTDNNGLVGKIEACIQEGRKHNRWKRIADDRRCRSRAHDEAIESSGAWPPSESCVPRICSCWC